VIVFLRKGYVLVNQRLLREVGVDRLWAIADQFQYQGAILAIQPFGSGNINDTYLVQLDSPTEHHFVLQRINTHVFRQPQHVMQNICCFTDHVQQRLQDAPLPPECRWEVPHVLRTRAGHDHWTADDGTYWRAIRFIHNAQTFDTIQDIHHAREIGTALGRFHALVCDLPPERLADTLEGFHITPLYLEQYEAVLAQSTVADTPDSLYCKQFIRDRAAWADVLERAKADGTLAVRLMHGDPKINNVMIDTRTGQAISLIDLDTVKPGLIHYDIGDCLRSCCNPLGEETEDWQAVHFEPTLGRAILEGYLAEAHSFLSEADCEYFFDALRLLSFELGLRFFTDYLAGNVYFKVKSPDHNLRRALVQFKLTESIEAQEAMLRSLIDELRSG
jgi:Ser/Thr protein kinase RdoA (MazF antagonist)